MTDERTESEITAEADDLVVRAKTDRAAFGALYERYYPQVAKYCLRRLFVRTIAEDVLSDVFLEVAAHITTFRGFTDTDFRRWLFRIATNAINAHLRQTTRRQEILDAAVKSGYFDEKGETHIPSPDKEMHDWPAVYRELLTLGERDRSIVMLRFFSDCTHEEIASVVDATAGAVRTSLSRILARLREKFKPAVAASPIAYTPRRD